jgi:pimeloyl-ACP methyl ester carboxylesterase
MKKITFLILWMFLAHTALFGQDKFFDSKGVRIHYIEQGTGVPIVLVHGRGGSVQGWITSGVMPDLAKDYRVIAMDFRGHGMSGKPHDPKQYGTEMALDILRLLDHLGISKAHVVGYSMGAMITSKLLTMHPDRFLTVTLGGGAGRFRWTAQDSELREQEAAETERLGFSPTLTRFLDPPNTPKLTEEEIKTRSAAALANPNQDRFALAALIRSFGEQVISPAQAAAIKVPTLGIAGSEDILLSDLQALKKLRPDLKLIVIDGATHGGVRGAQSRPEFVAAVREFIEFYSQTPFR